MSATDSHYIRCTLWWLNGLLWSWCLLRLNITMTDVDVWWQVQLQVLPADRWGSIRLTPAVSQTGTNHSASAGELCPLCPRLSVTVTGFLSLNQSSAVPGCQSLVRSSGRPSLKQPVVIRPCLKGNAPRRVCGLRRRCPYHSSGIPASPGL